MKKFFLILLDLILFLNLIKKCILIECNNRDYPFLKGSECVSSCSTSEINGGICKVKNEIIKTQWLNNIIFLSDGGFFYLDLTVSENNNLYCLVSGYPESSKKIVFILDDEGYGYLNKSNPLTNKMLNDPSARGRYDAEIFTFKLFENNNKEYLISISKGTQYMEIYDFYEDKIYFNNINIIFGNLINIFTITGPHLKLYSKENNNIYLIGLLACQFLNGKEIPYFYLQKVSFTSLDIKNNPPTYETQNIQSSKSKIISCYETSNHYIVCFYNNPNYLYTMAVYSYDLSMRNSIIISVGSSNVGYEELFFKCIHFFGETGVFGYFTNEDNPIIAFQFKKYINDSNSIEDNYITIPKINISNYYFYKEYVVTCNMIKVEDKKFIFAGISIDKDILYIISLFNYNEEKFKIRIYSINFEKLYNLSISNNINVGFYKNFLALAANYKKNDIDYSYLTIFSYPNTLEINLDLIDYLSNNNEIKISNLILELNGEYIMENNIFGYIYSGIQIIENCNELEDIYLANLNNEKINYNYFLPQKEKIKLVIPKNDVYEPFTCKIKYAAVVTEPEYSEYNKYPIKINKIGESDDEEDYFSRKNYIGKYSFYNIILKDKLTETNCENINCDLCYYNNITKCAYIIINDINSDNLTDINSININDFNNDLNEIKNKIKNNNIENILTDSLINKIKKEKKDIIIKNDDVVYHITTTENQNNTLNNNISRIILGECEKILKDKYKIDENEPLIIFKIEYFEPNSLIPIIGYEVFHPKNKSKLDLNYCKNEHIDLNIPVNIDEDNLFKYDPNSDYYTDECYPYTTENGTDILINDRQYEYNDNNMALCENNCSYIGYDKDTKEAKCECLIKLKQIVVSEINNQTDILYYDNFTENNLTFNMVTMKCYYTLFTKDGLLTNIGSYLLFFTILLFLVSGIIFYKCGYNLLEMDIDEIISLKEKKKIKNSPNKKNNQKNNKKEKKHKDIKIFKIKSNNTNGKNKDISKYSVSKIKLKKNKSLTYFNEKNNRKILNDKKYNDYELNSLSYLNALKYDKRTFLEYYISLIKRKQPIIFSFYPVKDYNLKLIKVDLFFLFFSIYNFINALFFNESVIHKIYEEKGIYNFGFFIPIIIYSFIISHILCTLIKYFSLSERNIYEIKFEGIYKKACEKAKKVKKLLIIKYICFFCFGLIFLFFLWYYLSSFSAVYTNTQKFLIINSIISFTISFIYPFIINLIPCFLRKYSLKHKNKDCIYKTSKILKLI